MLRLSWACCWASWPGSAYCLSKTDTKAPLRPIFVTSENWPLRGLYWLSKDFFDEAIKETTEPDSGALAEIRNQLEHKYLKVHQASIQKMIFLLS